MTGSDSAMAVRTRIAATGEGRRMERDFASRARAPPRCMGSCVGMARPAYTRMQVDERRAQLELGARLFATHSYGELSMAKIAREAGISKALLYHYFPSKQDFFVAALQQGAEDITRWTELDPDLLPLEALSGSLDAFLGLDRGERDRVPQAHGERGQRARGEEPDRRH